jgi:hypothetical protein
MAGRKSKNNHSSSASTFHIHAPHVWVRSPHPTFSISTPPHTLLLSSLSLLARVKGATRDAEKQIEATSSAPHFVMVSLPHHQAIASPPHRISATVYMRTQYTNVRKYACTSAVVIIVRLYTLVKMGLHSCACVYAHTHL